MSKETVPESIGVIMDGNRRFAKAHGISTAKGHEQGFETFKKLIDWAEEFHIKNITAYCFSTENWKRNKLEVKALMLLFKKAFTEVKNNFSKNIRIRVIGNIEDFPKDIQAIIKSIHSSKEKADLTVNLALSYGGRDEIVRAIRKAKANRVEITEKNFTQFFDNPQNPDPDLIIRTGGEMRLSNFLLWQAAYSELFFTKTLWPAFTKVEFASILGEYGRRKRNFGK